MFTFTCVSKYTNMIETARETCDMYRSKVFFDPYYYFVLCQDAHHVELQAKNSGGRGVGYTINHNKLEYNK